MPSTPSVSSNGEQRSFTNNHVLQPSKSREGNFVHPSEASQHLLSQAQSYESFWDSSSSDGTSSSSSSDDENYSNETTALLGGTARSIGRGFSVSSSGKQKDPKKIQKKEKKRKNKKMGHKTRFSAPFLMFSRGAVLWRVWAGVLGHTLLATAVVCITMLTPVDLGVSNIMMTVLGVVIGFVISLRASAGLDRYWQGRSAWSDLMRQCRTLGRLTWFHIPTWIPPAPNKESKLPMAPRERVKEEDIQKGLEEKKAFMDLILGYAVAVKHHLRGEGGIYYEDLYKLVADLPQFSAPFASVDAANAPNSANRVKQANARDPHEGEHEEERAKKDQDAGETHQVDQGGHEMHKGAEPDQQPQAQASRSDTASTLSPADAGGKKGERPSILTKSPPPADTRIQMPSSPADTVRAQHSQGASGASTAVDPSAYGTFGRRGGNAAANGAAAHGRLEFGVAGDGKEQYAHWGVLSRIGSWFGKSKAKIEEKKKTHHKRIRVHEDFPPLTPDTPGPTRQKRHHLKRRTVRQQRAGGDMPGHKYCPSVGDLSKKSERHFKRLDPNTGEIIRVPHHLNIPLSILWSMSMYIAVIDHRGAASNVAVGTTTANIHMVLMAMEDTLTLLEKILTTPLPFVFASHLRTIVWLYLLFLPFQLVGHLSGDFGWLTIPGTAVASFFYLGFLAAGEEIEQPFGMDANDLDLDSFCDDIIAQELLEITSWRCSDLDALRGVDGIRGTERAVEWMVNRKKYVFDEDD